MTHKGKFIVFEGGEGTGKTIQTKLFAGLLRERGKDVLEDREPSHGQVGLWTRENALRPDTTISNFTMQFLLCADRADHVEKTIIPTLENGTTIVCDRYFPSTVVYGSLSEDAQKIGMKRMQDFLIQMNALFPRPDVIFYLDVDPQVAFERINVRGARIERFDKPDFMAKAREGYKAFGATYRQTGQGLWVEIDASQSIEKVHQDVVKMFDAEETNLLRAAARNRPDIIRVS